MRTFNSFFNVSKAFKLTSSNGVGYSELKNRTIVRRSIVASKDILIGETLTEDNLTTKRPAVGINPMDWDQVIGTEAKRDFKADEAIEL